jgi:hypothetical protein
MASMLQWICDLIGKSPGQWSLEKSSDGRWIKTRSLRGNNVGRWWKARKEENAWRIPVIQSDYRTVVLDEY